MTKSETFNRLLATAKESTPLNLNGAIADGTNDEFIVDIYTPVALDGGGTANKVLFRVILPYSILETDTDAIITLNALIYSFAGNATTYSAGGTTPALSTAIKANTIQSLDGFLTAAGNGRTVVE